MILYQNTRYSFLHYFARAYIFRNLKLQLDILSKDQTQLTEKLDSSLIKRLEIRQWLISQINSYLQQLVIWANKIIKLDSAALLAQWFWVSLQKQRINLLLKFTHRSLMRPATLIVIKLTDVCSLQFTNYASAASIRLKISKRPTTTSQAAMYSNNLSFVK